MRPGTGVASPPGGTLPGSPGGVGTETRPAPALRRRYEAYRRTQAARFLTLLPSEGIRPLYRAARARAEELGTPPPDDPMEILHGYVLAHLPLPPFEVWSRDLARNPTAYLEEMAEGPWAPSESEPLFLETRPLVHGGAAWRAGLHVFERVGVWWGYIVFETGAGDPSFRTAPVFRDAGPDEVRRRFLSFSTATLAAFLRSVLP